MLGLVKVTCRRRLTLIISCPLEPRRNFSAVPASSSFRSHHDLAERRAGIEQFMGGANFRELEALEDRGADGAVGEVADHLAHDLAPAFAVVIIDVKGKAADRRADVE